jgi:hypothetical protein
LRLTLKTSFKAALLLISLLSCMVGLYLFHGGEPFSDDGSIPAELRYLGPLPDSAASANAKGISIVPGAIVCPNYQTTSMVFDLFVNSWEESAQDRFSNGQSRLMRGKAAPKPEPQEYGCVLLPPGTPLWPERGNMVPVVRAQIGSHWLRGVTLPDMISLLNPYVAPSIPTTAHGVSNGSSVSSDSTSTSDSDVWSEQGSAGLIKGSELKLDSDSITLNGISYPREFVSKLDGAALVNAAGLLALPVTSETRGSLWSLSVPEDFKLPSGNSYCDGDTRWLLEIEQGGDKLRVGFFKGEAKPVFLGNSESGFCEGLLYVRP